MSLLLPLCQDAHALSAIFEEEPLPDDSYFAETQMMAFLLPILYLELCTMNFVVCLVGFGFSRQGFSRIFVVYKLPSLWNFVPTSQTD